MIKITLLALFSIALLISCSQKQPLKKIVIIGRGKITATDNKVSMTDGAGYAEETVELPDGKPVDWDVSTPSGKRTIHIPAEEGIYILNLKTDTIVGSLQNIGQDLQGRTITQEELKVKIDSLQNLLAGSNISTSNHNYFILPNQLTSITTKTDSKIFGPFTKISRSIETDKDGHLPEIYKFYTTDELREIIKNFKKATY